MEMSEEKHLNCTTGDDVIDLSASKLLNFPTEFFIQSNIKFCYLNDNQLTKLPSTFFQNFKQLEWLDLRNNYLEELPILGLAGHHHLQVLLLQSNRIKHLPMDLIKVPHLKGLQISGNPIENVPFQVIASGFKSVIDFLCTFEEPADVPLPVSETFITQQNHRGKVKKSKIKALDTRRPSANFKSSSTTCSYKSQRTSLLSNILVTEEKIEIQEQEDRQKAMLRETLERQSLMLQRIKDHESMKRWRQITRSESKKKFLDNFQYSPSRNFIDKTPFDVDVDMLQMLNRADLYKTLNEVNAQPRKSQRKRPKNFDDTIRDVQSQIDVIKNKLDAMDFKDQVTTNSDKKYYLTTRVDEINKLRNQLIKLHGINFKWYA